MDLDINNAPVDTPDYRNILRRIKKGENDAIDELEDIFDKIVLENINLRKILTNIHSNVHKINLINPK
jgi:hypothetical protein